MSKNEMVEVNEYAVIKMDSDSLAEVIEANIGGQGISRFDLDKLKVPGSGGTIWEVPTLEGTEAKEEVEGIILHWKDVRAFWFDDYSGDNSPPDCYSDDTIIGVGDPGGKCKDCPYSQWGSADKGDGQKCKQMRIMFLLRKDDILPLALTAPPTSVKNIRNYFMRLASRGIPFYGVVTGLNLEKAKSSTGIDYSQIKPEYKERIEPEMAEEIKAYREKIKSRLEEVRIDQKEDVVDVEEIEDDEEEAYPEE